ncbi:MAG: hypothetical protein P4L77_12935 [Sulfuriferula sp.]|nr:hypothetical protein [Sulfuriferula sp.]
MLLLQPLLQLTLLLQLLLQLQLTLLLQPLNKNLFLFVKKPTSRSAFLLSAFFILHFLGRIKPLSIVPFVNNPNGTIID